MYMDHSHSIWDSLKREDQIKLVKRCVMTGICFQGLKDVMFNRMYAYLKPYREQQKVLKKSIADVKANNNIEAIMASVF